MEKTIDKVMFIGSKQMGFNALKRMYELAPDALCGCVTYDDRNDTRSVYDSIIQFCNEKEIPSYSLTGRCDISQIIIDNNPDICFVIGWYFIIQKKTLDRVPYGFLGIHASLLPAYRGHAPLVWAMINGEKETGYSIFQLEDGVDTGKILYSEGIEIDEADYISDVLKKVEDSTINFFSRKYRDILKGQFQWEDQQGMGSFGAKRIEEDGKIEWNKDSKAVYDFVRAQSDPYPGAYTFFREKKLIVWRAKKVSGIFYGTCGQVAYIDAETKNVGIICGKGSAIELEEVEIEGVRYRPAELIKSLNIRFQ